MLLSLALWCNMDLVWFLLLAVSDGPYNRGNVSVVAQFTKIESCEQAKKEFASVYKEGYLVCLKTHNIRPK